MIKVGDTIPAATLMEYVEVEGNGCSIGPNAVDVKAATTGKTIAVFALPGAFTPTCSAKHVPGYLEQHAALSPLASMRFGVWPSTMHSSWAHGHASWARLARCACWVMAAPIRQSHWPDLGPDRTRHGLAQQPLFDVGENGVVKSLNVEAPAKFEVSDATTLLAQAKSL